MYQNLRSSGALSYEKIERMFEEHQGKWPEAIFNEDSYFKYIAPFVNDNANYLDMLLGSKEEQRKWWLYNRFRYIDSKYIAGDAKDDMIFLRPYVAGDITISPYADIYATIAWDATITQERAARNQTVTLHCPYAEMNGNIVNIYSSSQLKSVGDLSTLKVGQIDIHNATRLQSLKIGDSDSEYENANLYSLTFGNNVLLKSVDVRNCVGFGDTTLQNHTQTTVDMSGCSIIEDVYFTGTKIQSVTLPNGGMVKNLYLPKTITNLTIRNQSKLINFEVEDDDYSNITTLRIENSSSVIPVLDILEQMPGNKTSRVRILGLNMTVSSTQDVEDFYDALDDMRGLDEAGNNTEYPVVQGTITGLGTITGAWLAEMRARYPDIAIEYEHITSNLYYYNGSTLYYTESITDGGNGVYAGTPSKTSDAQYSYTFAGWSLENDNTVDTDARSHVTEDRNVYACYTSTLRTYTVTWVNANGTTLETDTNVPYGSTPTYNGATPTYNGQTSTGWSPAVAPVTGDQTYTAVYVPIYNATFALSATDSDTGSPKTLQIVQVQEGSTPAYTGATPTTVQGDSTEFTFTGWSPAPAPIYASTTYTAQFQDNRSLTVQYLSRNITEYESDSNTKFATDGLGYATRLTSAKAPATSVEGYAFRIDNALEVVDLSATSGAVTIAQFAFNGCASLQHLIIRSSTMATLIGTNAFTDTPIARGEGAIYVPTSLVATYKANTNWSNYCIADIADYPLSDFSTISDSWSTIINNANYATDYVIGDTKLVDLGTFGQHYFELVALDNDTKADGNGKARMTWLSKNVLVKHSMNVTAITTGGYDASNMKSWIINDVLPQLQSEIRNAIVPVTKISSIYENGSLIVNGQSTTETLWIPSNYEIFGNFSYENTGARYSKFANASSRKKIIATNFTAQLWWLRSVMNDASFRCVNGGGNTDYSAAHSSFGVVLGFCI